LFMLHGILMYHQRHCLMLCTTWRQAQAVCEDLFGRKCCCFATHPSVRSMPSCHAFPAYIVCDCVQEVELVSLVSDLYHKITVTCYAP
jgi:hypothetical protein